MVRARTSLSVEYALAFKNPGPYLKRFITVVGGMLDNMVGSNTTKADCYNLLLRVATCKFRGGVGHLDSVLTKKGHPLLFLTAICKAGLLQDLLGDPLDEGEDETYEDRGWGYVGDDASKGWCGTARTRDLESFRKSSDLTTVQKKNQIARLVRQHKDGAEVDPESETVKAARCLEELTQVYITLLGMGELESFGAGVDGVMGGGVGVGEGGGGGGGGVGGGGGIHRTMSAMVAAASRVLDMSALKVNEEYVTLFAQMAIWSNDLLSTRQLFPLSGAHQSAFIDISVWHGITKERAQKMVGESMIMVEERKDKVYKRWISIVLDSQAYGAKNATPGYLSRMNPNYIRWGVDPQTRDKYAGAAGQLLAWGIKVQKHPFLAGIPLQPPDDQYALLACMINIHTWIIWMSTDPLGAQALFEFMQVAFAVWEPGREGGISGGLEGGIFTEIGVSTAKTVLSGLMYVIKSTWAAEKLLMTGLLRGGGLTLRGMSEEQRMVWDAAMSDSNAKELFVLIAKFRSLQNWSGGKELLEIRRNVFAVDTDVISLKDVKDIHDVLEDLVMGAGKRCFEWLGTAMVKLMGGDAQILVNDGDHLEVATFALRWKDGDGRVVLTQAEALAELLVEKLAALGRSAASAWLDQYYEYMALLDVFGQLGGQIRGTQWRKQFLRNIRGSNAQRSFRVFNHAPFDDGVCSKAVVHTQKIKIGSGTTAIETNSIALGPTATVHMLLFCFFRAPLIRGLTPKLGHLHRVKCYDFAHYVFVGKNGNLNEASATSDFKNMMGRMADIVNEKRMEKQQAGPKATDFGLQNYRHVCEKLVDESYDERFSMSGREREEREVVGRATAGHGRLVAAGYTANEKFVNSTFDRTSANQISMILGLGENVAHKMGFSNRFGGRKDEARGRLVVKEDETTT
ncbi:hypothetical protein TrCOL_g9620, partial [Triparma columacea]